MKKRNPIIRFFAHLFSHRWQVNRYFSSSALQNIEHAIAASEQTHAGEICFVVEAGLHPYEILARKTPRKRAIEVFSRFHIWDTEHNNGVLIYLLLADRDVEILADRGIDAHIGHAQWNAICNEMEVHLRAGNFEAGVLQGISRISSALEQHFPLNSDTQRPKKRRNELPNKPRII